MLNYWINLNLWKAEKGNKVPKGPPTFLNHSASLELSSLTDKLFLPPPPLPTCWLLIITSQQSEQHIFHLCGAHFKLLGIFRLTVHIIQVCSQKKVQIKGREVLSNFDDAKLMF